MKKALVIAALVGLVASPAMAAVVPTPISNWTATPINGTLQNGTVDSGRSFPYSANDPGHIYDNLPFDFGVGGPATYTGGLYINGTILNDDVHFKNPTNTLTSIHWIYYNPGAGTGNATWFFFSNPGGADTAIGTTLAAFQFSGIPSGFILLTGTVGPVGLPQDVWMGVSHNHPFGSTFMLLGGLPVNGAIGTGKDFQFAHTSGSSYTIIGTIFNTTQTSPARYIGSGHSPLLAFTAGGSFVSITGAQNLQAALGGSSVPEPATIALLAGLGLFVLRRRRA